MARPTKLTPFRHARIVELLSDGVPFATACRKVDVSPARDMSGCIAAGDASGSAAGPRLRGVC
jgi:hypothetical protein